MLAYGLPAACREVSAMKKHKRMSLNKKIVLIPLSVFIPMLCVVVYLLVTLMQSVNEYNGITESVTYANHYSKEFKERMDYTMYLAVIGNKTVDELGNGETTINGIVTVNPYTYMDELSKICKELSNMATASINKTQIRFVENSLKSLRKCVAALETMIADGSSYDDKIAYLDENIRGQSGLTTVIQGAIQNYIYEETRNFAYAKEELERNVATALRISIFIIAAAILASLLLSSMAVQSITRPIRKLCNQTKKVARGDFTAKTKIDTVDEIAVLTDSFNVMTAEIGSLVEDIKKQEENLRLTESKLLQAQINPHFLYNTLDTIVWLAEAKETKEVVSMVTTLSEFFRTTLSKGKDYITIKEEEEHIRSYLRIQQFRYQDIMEYEIDIAPELHQYKIPKLTLQPLVENALYHGIKKKRGKGLIRITGWKEGMHIYLEVADDGIGMNMYALERLRRSIAGVGEEMGSGGFGLANVNQRLQYYYGAEYGVFFESEENKGTKATVIIEAKDIQPFS